MNKDKILDIIDERLRHIEQQRNVWNNVSDVDDCKGLVLKALHCHHLDLTQLRTRINEN